MATAPIIDNEETEVANDDTPGKITLAEILSGKNLIELLDAGQVSKIGQDVIRDYRIDENSRTNWLNDYKKSLDLAMQVVEPKSFPWPNASNVKYPLLTVACIQFNAMAYPAIVDGSNLVKGRVLGPDPDGTKRERADRMGQHMSYQLLYKMDGWEEETDKLLLILPINGCVIRKSYYDKIRGTNCSDLIPAEDFVINYWAKSLNTAPRYTHVLHYYPYEARELIAAGLWVDVPISSDPVSDKVTSEDDDAAVDFFEQHRMIDLDDDGIQEHYVVTTTTEGQVARIVPCFDMSNVYMQVGGEVKKASDLTEQELDAPDHPIVRIERAQYFTKYGFIPAPDGSFYDIGFGKLLLNHGEAIDGTINRMMDAGALQNAQGGFIGAGVNIKSGDTRIRLGEWKRLDTGSVPLKDAVMPLNLPGPSPVLMQLLEMLISSARDITNSSDALTGNSPATEQPTTLLARIEQAQKVMKAVIKRIHRAFGCELRILRRLNKDFLDENEYFQLNDESDPEAPRGQPGQAPQQQPQMQIGRADYEDDDLDVIPVSDPTIVSDVQKMAKAQALMAFNGDPLVNQLEVRQRYFEAIGEPDIKKLLAVPPPPPDPKMLIDGAKTAVAKKLADNATITAKANAAKVLSDAALTLESMGLTQDAAQLAAMATQLGGESDGDEHAGGQGPVPAMDGQPTDGGLPQPPDAAPPMADGGMGQGPPGGGLPGASGVGGDPSPTGGPVA